jgi:hypothetical protein
MKWTLIIGGLFAFGYFLVPLLFRAMKHHDYDNLYHGMQNARIEGGSFHDNNKAFISYTDRYMYGNR